MQNQNVTSNYANRFSGKVGLVTGAGQGIGRGVAIRLAAEGAFVGVLDWKAASAGDTVEIIKGHGGSAIRLQADVSKQDQVTECVEKLKSTCGRVDLLVNNAGFDRPGGFLKLTSMSFVEVFNVHVSRRRKLQPDLRSHYDSSRRRSYCQRVVYLWQSWSERRIRLLLRKIRPCRVYQITSTGVRVQGRKSQRNNAWPNSNSYDQGDDEPKI